MAQNALQMPHTAAAAEALLGIERDHAMAGFPNAFGPWIAAEPQPASQRPDANDLVEFAARRRDAGSHRVGVVENQNPR